ncbi:hypothetical protein J2X31_003171 [Flavobacterium arsenatis]|uniref:MvaI/BcnI restriction endonuclease domain-containing protein n=1 Tax=Flavobacterium arsenatis TaxID=1484332 RepID=A0ABU1TTE0_9FLAO|nr:hypothetical protein [Flavobacterium arsenatis]MDR6969144.1 hypothetical protein [Flavobacterium arsenatis]
MNNETFGITLQYAVCIKYKLNNKISSKRIDENLLSKILKSNILGKIFRGRSPIKYLADSKDFTSEFITKSPHNFLLKNNETLSIKSFKGNGKMFAPKVVGQSGLKVLNHYFGDLYPEEITRDNFKQFCLENVNEILPILIDYALVSDYNCYIYLLNEEIKFEIIKRGNFPELTFEKEKFTFTKANILEWNESTTVKYDGQTVLEMQLHKNRFYKFRLHSENFPQLIKREIRNNNSLLGDTAELAICNVFGLESGVNNDRLLNNSDKIILNAFEKHYTLKKPVLFPLKPIKYSGTEKRDRGGHSKSGVDFYLENDATLSVKTNKSKAFKVCPPEVGQPSPKTFDLYFSKKGWYDGNMDEEKFRILVTDKEKLSLLLSEYVKFLNECDYILWSLYLNENDINSKLVVKCDLENITFNPNLICYSNDFTDKSSVTIKYGENRFSLGEFQVHSARNSLKFRFNINNLLSV